MKFQEKKSIAMFYGAVYAIDVSNVQWHKRGDEDKNEYKGTGSIGNTQLMKKASCIGHLFLWRMVLNRSCRWEKSSYYKSGG